MGRGKHSEQSENFKGKMLISLLIMVVLAGATAVLVFTAPVPEDGYEDPNNGVGQIVNRPITGDTHIIRDPDPLDGPLCGLDGIFCGECDLGYVVDEDGNRILYDGEYVICDNVMIVDPGPVTGPDDPAYTTPQPNLNAVAIHLYGRRNPSADISVGVNDRYQFEVRIDPPGIEDVDIEWTSSNSSAVAVVPDDPSGRTATITGLARGSSNITVTVNGEVSSICIVRVR